MCTLASSVSHAFTIFSSISFNIFLLMSTYPGLSVLIASEEEEGKKKNIFLPILSLRSLTFFFMTTSFMSSSVVLLLVLFSSDSSFISLTFFLFQTRIFPPICLLHHINLRPLILNLLCFFHQDLIQEEGNRRDVKKMHN